MGTSFRQIQYELFAVGTHILWFSYSFTFIFANIFFYVFANVSPLPFCNALWWWIRCTLCSVRYVKSQKRFNLFNLLNSIICECILLHIFLFWLFCHYIRFVFILFFDVCSNLCQCFRLFKWNIKIFGCFVWFFVVDIWSWRFFNQ